MNSILIVLICLLDNWTLIFGLLLFISYMSEFSLVLVNLYNVNSIKITIILFLNNCLKLKFNTKKIISIRYKFLVITYFDRNC